MDFVKKSLRTEPINESSFIQMIARRFCSFGLGTENDAPSLLGRVQVLSRLHSNHHGLSDRLFSSSFITLVPTHFVSFLCSSCSFLLSYFLLLPAFFCLAACGLRNSFACWRFFSLLFLLSFSLSFRARLLIVFLPCVSR